MAWVFQGNPDKFDLDDYVSRYPELLYWRTPAHSKDIAIGDQIFIWRAGKSAGAIAHGTVVETPCEASQVRHPSALGSDLWFAAPPDPREPKTGIRLDDMRLTPAENMVTRGEAMAIPILAGTQLIKAPRGTVFWLDEQATAALERLWGLTPHPWPTLPSSATEGSSQLRSHRVRERSGRLRADKIRQMREVHGQLACELCAEGELDRYPLAMAERVFEIHHRAPLANAASPVRTTLDDLAVLCANCHRAVHATADAPANFNAMKRHFAAQQEP